MGRGGRGKGRGGCGKGRGGGGGCWQPHGRRISESRGKATRRTTGLGPPHKCQHHLWCPRDPWRRSGASTAGRCGSERPRRRDPRRQRAGWPRRPPRGPLRLGPWGAARHRRRRAQQRGRPAAPRRSEPPSVVHWNGSQLQRSPLPQFARGGRLLRVGYPHWACQCHVPAASTLRASVVVEQELRAQEDGAVARQAGSALRRGWAPRWSQAGDLEFCIEMKTGSSLPFELHARGAVRSGPLTPLGCALRGEAAPSKLFGAGGSEGAGPPAGQQLQLSAHPQDGSQPAAAQESFTAPSGRRRPAAFRPRGRRRRGRRLLRLRRLRRRRRRMRRRRRPSSRPCMAACTAWATRRTPPGAGRATSPSSTTSSGAAARAGPTWPTLRRQWSAAGCAQGWGHLAAAQAFAQGGCGACGALPEGHWSQAGAQETRTCTSDAALRVVAGSQQLPPHPTASPSLSVNCHLDVLSPSGWTRQLTQSFQLCLCTRQFTEHISYMILVLPSPVACVPHSSPSFYCSCSSIFPPAVWSTSAPTALTLQPMSSASSA
ncbi:unnamed protein product [Prorocentrum cordatum]|uniref:Beta-galactosidase n=1 Tax=Prorocentrum cordatum TaxID=2364126 RepID=A0ABN9TBD6_9DINO|nr:unnamed protein product [Polarella glacialis]